MTDQIIDEINNSFDQAEKMVKQDLFNNALIDLYNNLKERADKGEFNKTQLKAILARYKKTEILINALRNELKNEALDHSERRSKIKQYIRNSFTDNKK